MDNSVTQSDLQGHLRLSLDHLGVNFPANLNLKIGENLLAKTSFGLQNPNSWLSLGLPRERFSGSSRDSLFWCPCGFPPGTSIFVASSRLGRTLDDHHDWFNAFRTLVCRINADEQFLITANGTAADRFVKRAANLFGLNLLDLQSAPNKLSPRWFAKTRQCDCQDSFPCFVIPVVETMRSVYDEILTDVAHEVRVLSVRSGGQVEKAVCGRCDKLEHPNVLLLDSKSQTKRKLQDQLLEAGCHRWLLIPNEEDILGATHGACEFRIPVTEQLPDGEFLIHCTRPRVGPWPDQDEAQFLDDLIFQETRSDHSANAALARIMATGFIWGTNQLTRDQQNVVCFTAVGLNHLKTLRKFRSHLSRWDFLPVGIAIRKSALQSVGARPVIYGDESTWDSLPETDQPYFQVSNTETKKGNAIDWTLEQEWRLVGDLNLNQFREGEIYAIRSDEFI